MGVSGKYIDHEAFMNQTLAREKIEATPTVTVNTTVAPCFLRSELVVTAPFPGCYDGPCAVGTTPSANELWDSSTEIEHAWRGTGIATSLPCWFDGVPCVTGQTSDYDNRVGCSWYEGWKVNAPGSNEGDGYYVGRGAAFKHEGNEMGEKAKRFPWCSV